MRLDVTPDMFERVAQRSMRVLAALFIVLAPDGAASAPSRPKAAKPPAVAAKTQKPKASTRAPTAPKAKPAPPAPIAPLPPAPLPQETPLDTSAPPPSLPRASREKMRACAEEWERKKLATKSGLPMWREFATQCLTR